VQSPPLPPQNYRTVRHSRCRNQPSPPPVFTKEPKPIPQYKAQTPKADIILAPNAKNGPFFVIGDLLMAWARAINPFSPSRLTNSSQAPTFSAGIPYHMIPFAITPRAPPPPDLTPPRSSLGALRNCMYNTVTFACRGRQREPKDSHSSLCKPVCKLSGRECDRSSMSYV